MSLRWLKRRAKDTAVAPQRRLVYRDPTGDELANVYVSTEEDAAAIESRLHAGLCACHGRPSAGCTASQDAEVSPDSRQPRDAGGPSAADEAATQPSAGGKRGSKPRHQPGIRLARPPGGMSGRAS